MSELGSAGFDLAGFCAHPDDAELIMGGTLVCEAARGRRVALVDLTRGEAGSRGTPELREAEAREAARILGVEHREALGLPDGRLDATPEQKDVVVAALRRLRPRVVVLQHWEQRHPDHAAASRIVYDAAFLAGLRNYRPELGLAYRPFKMIYAMPTTEAVEISPSFVVDVTSFWQTKLGAIAAFHSQFAPSAADEGVDSPFERFKRNVELSGRRAGARIGVAYGEAFATREPLSVASVCELRGGSF